MRIWLSLAFLACLMIVWIWDWYVIVKGQPRETVSATVLEWSQQWPILPLLCGIIIGHIFWPNR